MCDKSIEALSLIEEKILGKPIDMQEHMYKQCLSAQRRKAVKEKEDLFRKMNAVAASQGLDGVRGIV